MFRRFFLASLLLALSAAPAAAQWTGSVGYSHFTDDFDVGVIVGSFGYEFPVADGFSLVPEFRAGVGVVDDTINVGGTRVDFEIENLYGFSNRFQFDFGNDMYAFGVVSHVNYKTKASSAGMSVSDRSWEWGFGGGLGYMFNPNNGLDFSWERIDGDVDRFNLGWRFRF